MNALLPLLLLTTLDIPMAADSSCGLDGPTSPRNSESRVTEGTEISGSPSAIRPEKGRFLIASHTLGDPNFSETVVLLLAYDADGAMGIIINRPTDVRLAAALPDLQELRHRSDRVYLAGPVAVNRMLLLVRSSTRPEASQPIFGDVYASSSVNALRKAIAHTGKGNRLRVYVGHAGWGPGQLDHEIARGDWYVSMADAATIFDRSASSVWPKLIDRFTGEWADSHSCQCNA